MSEQNVLATVGGVQITDLDIDAYIMKMPPEQKAYASNPYFRQQVLQQLINIQLFVKLGEEKGIAETEGYKVVMENIAREMLAQFAIQSVVDAVTVSEEEAKAYYADHAQEFVKPESVSAKHILVECPGQCQSIADDIKAGKVTFEEAAQEHSTCPSKAQGGDLGTFGRGQMVKEFEDAAFAAEIGEIVGPVKTQFGNHIIQVYAKTEASVPSFEEAREQIDKELLQDKQNQAYQQTLADLQAKYVQQ